MTGPVPVPPAAGADATAVRWRLLLGADADGQPVTLPPREQAMDAALAGLYNRGAANRLGGRGARGDLTASAPSVARWLGDIRSCFPTPVVQVMQADAMERLRLRQLLLEPEMLEVVQPDIHLVATLASLSAMIPEQSRHTARQVVARLVAEVERRIATRTRTAVTGALQRAARSRRPRPADIDWNRTIRANLRTYLPERRTVVPEQLVGHGRRRRSIEREVVLCVDQSASMAASVVHASIFACILASMRSLRTSLVVYDTSVVDLSDRLSDPVDVIFGTQLGGGTNASPALDHCARLVTRPRDTLLVVISDLFDSAPDEMLRRLASLKRAGVAVVVLLALSDDGVPSYDQRLARELAALGIPAFACTPDEFPDLIAAAIRGDDMVGFVERARTGPAGS